MQCQEGTELSQVLSVLPLHLQEMLCRVNEKTADALSEIRLRSGRPIVLVTPQNTYFLTKTGKTTCICSDNLPTISESEISDIVARACGFSVHSHQEELKNGFLTLPGGHRIGVCGTAVRQNGCVAGIRSPTALNPRCSARSIEHLFSSRFAKHPFSRSADEWEDNRSARSGNPNLAGLFGQALYLRRDRCAL